MTDKMDVRVMVPDTVVVEGYNEGLETIHKVGFNDVVKVVVQDQGVSVVKEDGGTWCLLYPWHRVLCVEFGYPEGE